jgi:hypothetical protein
MLKRGQVVVTVLALLGVTLIGCSGEEWTKSDSAAWNAWCDETFPDSKSPDGDAWWDRLDCWKFVGSLKGKVKYGSPVGDGGRWKKSCAIKYHQYLVLHAPQTHQQSERCELGYED